MAKVPVRILRPYKGLNAGATTSMSLGRSRDAAANGDVEILGNNKKPAKKVAKKAVKKTATKSIRGARNTSMRGKTKTK